MTEKTFSHDTDLGSMTVTGIEMTDQYMPPPHVLAILLNGYEYLDDATNELVTVEFSDIIQCWNEYTPDNIARFFTNLEQNLDDINHLYFILQCHGNGPHEYAYITQLLVALSILNHK